MVQFSDITGLLIVIVAISLVPFVAMVVTSYAKIVVVLGLLRNALGVQQVPPRTWCSTAWRYSCRCT
ncbi:type III secretory pathway component EscR [Paraburkholderia graminis]|uniref:Type III secretory pathway component EscR n=1 Tax=Paraburkholderia graminis TaxID=60548 RepID=A0ABD5CPW3_9BURK|nr:type III secretory pathway component EscR [Paraburkholderia graminis]